MKAYIYIIKNLTNSKVYVGSSKYPNKRKSDHFTMLQRGCHHSPHLQKSYNKYGRGSFEFLIIEECDLKDRKEREIYHISSFRSHLREFGYNVDEPNGDRFTCSEETKVKIRNTKNCISVDVYLIEDLTKIKTFPSQQDCENSLGIPRQMVSQILSGKRKSYKGLTFVLSGQPCTYIQSSRHRNMSRFYK